MIGHQHISDQVSKANGFRVEISGVTTPGSNEGEWRSIQGGGIRFEETEEGATFGPDKFKNHTKASSVWEPITLVGRVTSKRKECLSWYQDMVDTGDENACFKDVSVTVIGPDGGDLYTVNYLECFLQSYTLGELCSIGDAQPLYETIEICVGYSDNLLS